MRLVVAGALALLLACASEADRDRVTVLLEEDILDVNPPADVLSEAAGTATACDDNAYCDTANSVRHTYHLGATDLLSLASFYRDEADAEGWGDIVTTCDSPSRPNEVIVDANRLVDDGDWTAYLTVILRSEDSGTRVDVDISAPAEQDGPTFEEIPPRDGSSCGATRSQLLQDDQSASAWARH